MPKPKTVISTLKTSCLKLQKQLTDGLIDETIKNESFKKLLRKFIKLINNILLESDFGFSMAQISLNNFKKVDVNSLMLTMVDLQLLSLSLMDTFASMKRKIDKNERSSQKKDNSIKKLSFKLNQMNNGLNAFWHPSLSFCNLYKSSLKAVLKVNFNSVDWLLVSFGSGDVEKRFWTLEHVYFEQTGFPMDGRDINGNEFPREIRVITEEKLHSLYDKKMIDLGRRYEDRLKELLKEKNQLEKDSSRNTLEKTQEKSIQTQRENTKEKSIARINDENSKKELQNQKIRELSEILEKLSNSKNKKSSTNCDEDKITLSLTEFKEITHENVKLKKELKDIKGEYKEFKKQAETVLIEKNQNIADLSQLAIKHLKTTNSQVSPVNVGKSKQYRKSKDPMEWNDQLEYLKNIIVEFLGRSEMRKDLLPVLKTILRLDETQVDSIANSKLFD